MRHMAWRRIGQPESRLSNLFDLSPLVLGGSRAYLGGRHTASLRRWRRDVGDGSAGAHVALFMDAASDFSPDARARLVALPLPPPKPWPN